MIILMRFCPKKFEVSCHFSRSHSFSLIKFVSCTFAPDCRRFIIIVLGLLLFACLFMKIIVIGLCLNCFAWFFYLMIYRYECPLTFHYGFPSM
jgi:hypothetical protein